MGQAAVARAVRLLTLTSGLYSFSIGSVRPLVPLFALDLGATPLAVGLIVGLADFAPMLLALSAGILSDTLGPQSLIFTGTVTLLVSTVLRAAIPTIVALGAAQVLMGLSALAFFLAAQSYVVQLARPEQRARFFGMWSFYQNIGSLTGPVAGGVLADLAIRSGLLPADAYRVAFLAAGVVMVPAVVMAWRLPRVNPGLSQRWNASLQGTTGKAWRLGREHPQVTLGAFISLSIQMSSAIRNSFFPVFLANLGFSTSVVSLFYSAQELSSTVVRPFFGALTRQFGIRRLMIIGLAASVIGWGAIPVIPTTVAILCFSLLAGVGKGLGVMTTSLMVAGGAPSAQRGLALGIRQLANRFADGASPAVLGMVAAGFGVASTFVVSGLFAVVGLPILLRRKSGTTQYPGRARDI